MPTTIRKTIFSSPVCLNRRLLVKSGRLLKFHYDLVRLFIFQLSNKESLCYLFCIRVGEEVYFLIHFRSIEYWVIEGWFLTQDLERTLQ